MMLRAAIPLAMLAFSAQLASQVSIVRALPAVDGVELVEMKFESTALEALTRAAAVHGISVKTDPAAVELMHRRNIAVDRDQISLNELSLLVGHATGAEIAREESVIRCAAPSADGATSREARRRVASAHASYALAARPDEGSMIALSAAHARLLFEGGDFNAAFAAWQGAAGTKVGAASQERRLLAAESALRAGRIADAVAAIDAYESSDELPSDAPGSDLMPARVYLAAGDPAAAGVRLRRAIRESIYPRDRALAVLLLAEVARRTGDGFAMLEILDKFPETARRAYPDLVKRLPYAHGVALSLQGRTAEAVLNFRLAIREDAHPVRRVRAAQRVAEELLKTGRPFEALLAARQAFELAPKGAIRFEVALLQCELERSLGLGDRAFQTATAALAAATEPSPLTDKLLDLLAGAAVETRRFDEARAALEAMSRRPGFGPRVIRHEADLLRREGKPAEALKRLEKLTAETVASSGLTMDELSRLRGELALAAGDPFAAAMALMHGADEASGGGR